MQRLAEFLFRYRDHIAAALLAIIALTLMSYGNVTQLGGFRALIIGGLGLAQEAFAWIPNPIALEKENRALRQINLELQQEVMVLRRAGVENARLRRMLELKSANNLPLLPASVVGKTVFRTRQFLTIDRGSKDGVHPGMTVMTDAGLVGSVIATSAHYAVVQTLFNRDVRVSARLETTRQEGIVQWDGFDYLLLQNIPKTEPVNVGDRVLTSGLSTRYVPEIPIGRVTTVINDPTSMFYRITLEPAVEFGRLEHVFVVLKPPPQEQLLLERALQEYIDRRITGR
jgi:rod shape-determining protein MreC